MYISNNYLKDNNINYDQSILTLDELTLFKCSEELKNTNKYSNLYDALCQITPKRRIQIEDIYGLSEKALSILTYKKQDIKKILADEWEASGYGYDPNQNAWCNFCHRRNNKYYFYIKNNLNGIVLVIGSTCIGKFLKIKKIDEQRNLMEQDRTQRLFIKNNAELYGNSQNVNQYFEAEKYFYSLPILLPFYLYSNIKDAIYKMRLACLNFNSTSISFDYELNRYKELRSQADIFVQEHLNNPLICKKREADWIIANGKNKLLKEIANNNAMYTQDTISSVYSEEFAKSNMKIIAHRNKSNVIKFGECNTFYVPVLFKTDEYVDQILFRMPLQKLMGTIGSNCIFNDRYTYGLDDILSISTIMNTQTNITTIIQYANSILGQIDYAFLYNQSNDEVIIYRKSDSAIKNVNAYAFLKTYSKIITLSNEKIKENLYKIIYSIKSNDWITVKKQKNKGIYQKISDLYKKYEEVYI